MGGREGLAMTAYFDERAIEHALRTAHAPIQNFNEDDTCVGR